ncbi:hypothetical protein QAD02_009877 [Eretmocerus hayati]|uniref:Uncharacterized protein n=1 Tax=Eretmocerus hayati TaxID=131215 RepID=A0ACC2NAJ2_9HYME|nr:hypothetical protein QAD02_009877 [Eretmocerus hayati]
MLEELLEKRRNKLSYQQAEANQTQVDSGRSSLSSSTQTALDSSKTLSIPENARPHLVELLADIEQYARSIQQHFRELNESLRQNVSASAVTSVSPKSPEKRQSLDRRNALWQPIDANKTNISKHQDGIVQNESLILESLSPAAASTPRSKSNRRDTLVSLEDEQISCTVEAQASDRSTPPSAGVDDDDDDDETVYKELPDCLGRPPEMHLSDSDSEVMPVEDGLLEQMTQVVQEVGTIQEKIEKLRKDLLSDRANSPFKQQKQADKCDG